MESFLRVSDLQAAHSEDIASLRNWSKTNPCICRQELDVLSKDDDLLCLSTPDDNLIKVIERNITSKVLEKTDVSHNRKAPSIITSLITNPTSMVDRLPRTMNMCTFTLRSGQVH